MASPAYRGHTGKSKRSSLGERFRFAEKIVDNAGKAAGANAAAGQKTFEAGLKLAQAAERTRRAQAGSN